MTTAVTRGWRPILPRWLEIRSSVLWLMPGICLAKNIFAIYYAGSLV
jgi:hypothetical protein